MNKSESIDTIRQGRRAVASGRDPPMNSLTTTAAKTLQKGEQVAISVWQVLRDQAKARTGRNRRIGEPVEIKASKPEARRRGHAQDRSRGPT